MASKLQELQQKYAADLRDITMCSKITEIARRRLDVVTLPIVVETITHMLNVIENQTRKNYIKQRTAEIKRRGYEVKDVRVPGTKERSNRK